MTDSTITLPTGQAVSVQSLTTSNGTSANREVTCTGDPNNYLGVQAVKPASTLPSTSDGAAVVATRPDTLGTVGTDFSVNAPAWPNVGANFGGSGPYPSWVLLKTVAANTGRYGVELWNMSNEPVLVLRDDGTAITGAAPANASAFELNNNGSLGPVTWRSNTFKGRLQIYGKTSSDFVSIFVD